MKKTIISLSLLCLIPVIGNTQTYTIQNAGEYELTVYSTCGPDKVQNSITIPKNSTSKEFEPCKDVNEATIDVNAIYTGHSASTDVTYCFDKDFKKSDKTNHHVNIVWTQKGDWGYPNCTKQ